MIREKAVGDVDYASLCQGRKSWSSCWDHRKASGQCTICFPVPRKKATTTTLSKIKTVQKWCGKSTDLAVWAISYVTSLWVLQSPLSVIQPAWASHSHSGDHTRPLLGVGKVKQVMGRFYMLLKTLYSEDSGYRWFYDSGSVGDCVRLNPKPWVQPIPAGAGDTRALCRRAKVHTDS